MAWLRIDDGFCEHPKLLGLSRGDRWTWLELLTYCARQGNGGQVPGNIGAVLRRVSVPFLNRCEQVHLLDLVSIDGQDRFVIHDWDEYNSPTGLKREQARLRMKRYRERNAEHHESVTRAQPRAPVPSPTPEETYGSSSSFPSKPRTDSRYRKGDNTASYTGCRLVRGTHGYTTIHDPLGIDPPPFDWPHPKPTRAQILTALNAQALEPAKERAT